MRSEVFRERFQMISPHFTPQHVAPWHLSANTYTETNLAAWTPSGDHCVKTEKWRFVPVSPREDGAIQALRYFSRAYTQQSLRDTNGVWGGSLPKDREMAGKNAPTGQTQRTLSVQHARLILHSYRNLRGRAPAAMRGGSQQDESRNTPVRFLRNPHYTPFSTFLPMRARQSWPSPPVNST